MFNNLEECLFFEDALDYDLEECGSDIDRFTVDILSICMTDDTYVLAVEPRYDEYNDDYMIVSLEQFATGFSWRDDGLHTDFSNLNSIADDLEGCSYILFENDLEHNDVEQRVVLDILKPQDQIFFQYPFAGLLESFNGGVCYAMNNLSLDSRKILNIYVQQHFKWELSFSFFSLLKQNVSKVRVNSQLLDWLH
jgi:hypothetical protein